MFCLCVPSALRLRLYLFLFIYTEVKLVITSKCGKTPNGTMKHPHAMVTVGGTTEKSSLYYYQIELYFCIYSLFTFLLFITDQ